MFGLRQKLLLGFGGMLLTMAVIGTQSIVLLSNLSEATDGILQGDYRSVIACQNMKESLQLIDSGIELDLLENSQKSKNIVESNTRRFEEALDLELHNINLPGEAESAEKLRQSYEQFKQRIPEVLDAKAAEQDRRKLYLEVLRPLYEESLKVAEQILEKSQRSMDEGGQQVKAGAGHTVRQMYVMLLACSAITGVFFVYIRRWVLTPLQTLTKSVREVEHGNLDLAVNLHSRDELNEFANAFNAMAARLRDVRRDDRARLLRTQHTTQLAVDSFPEPVAVFNPEGQIETVNSAATELFGLKPGVNAREIPADWLHGILNPTHALEPVEPKGYESAIQIFDHGQERFFLPKAVPIIDESNRLAGTTLVLADITHLRKIDEMKSSLVSTTSHELKTPLTSLQMSILLLLEGKVGPLSAKQLDLLTAARGDVERLRGIVENILDLSRIEAGHVNLELETVKVDSLLNSAVNPLVQAFDAQGLSLTVDVRAGMPNVRADTSRIGLVFSNLLSNALKYTPRGGKVSVQARQGKNGCVEFSVSDTGPGIPSQYRDHVFEKFFRVPGQNLEGAGLGLAIAKEVVVAHGGEIRCNSEAGKGCMFTFTLRRADGKEQDHG